jgi:hypothetical protein
VLILLSKSHNESERTSSVPKFGRKPLFLDASKNGKVPQPCLSR